MKLKKNKNTKPSIYGLHAVREAWLNDTRAVHALYITPQTNRNFEKTLLESTNLGLRRPRPTVLEKQKLDKMLPKGAVHQGIAISCSPLDEMDDRDLAIQLHLKKNCIVAMLDQVTDPHNVGAILRSASAFGLDGVILQKKARPRTEWRSGQNRVRRAGSYPRGQGYKSEPCDRGISGHRIPCCRTG